jgi:hypothetical protein
VPDVLIMKIKMNPGKALAIGLACVILTSCKPNVEYVRFTESPARYPNILEIVMNTKKGLFTGRESFLRYKRQYVTVYSGDRTNEYTEKDLYLHAWNNNRMKYDSLTLKKANIRILKRDGRSMKIEIHIDDSLVPEMANGTYTLTLKECDSTGYTMYEYKK